jgi:O-antigen/teichoic acid export membrane protein
VTDVREGDAVAQRSLGRRLAELAGVSDAGRALRDFATYLPSQAVPAVASLVALPLLARRLTATELGVLALAQTLVSLGAIAVASWLAAAIVRELPRHAGNRSLDAFVHTLVHALGLVGVAFAVLAGLLAGATVISSAVGDNLGLILAAVAGASIHAIALSLLSGSLRPRAYALVDVPGRTGGIVLGMVLVFRGHGVGGYLFGLASVSVAVALLGLAFAWPARRRRTPSSPPSELGAWLRYGIPGSLAGAAVWALAFVDRYMLAALKDAAVVGIYTIGNVIGDRAVMIPVMALLTGTGPLLVTAWERQGREEVERLMRSYTRIVLLVGLPIVAYIAVEARGIVTALTGQLLYDEAAAVAPIVAAGSLLFALSFVGYTGLVVQRQTRQLAYAALAAVVVNVAANLVLIPPFGATGAAVATPIGTAGFLVASQVWSRRYVTWHFPWGTLARTVAAAAAGYGVARFATPAELPLSARLGAAAVLGAVTYVACLWMLGERRALDGSTVSP